MLNNSAIVIEDLHVRRGSAMVLDDFSVKLEAGRVIGIIGPSGCGKTTLIRSIAGVQRIVSGNVTVLGDPAGSAKNRRRVGYVTQASSVYPDLTAEQNLQYFAAVAGKSAADVQDAITTVGLTEHRNKLVASLSGGQRARVSLSAALVARCRLYLLDEPTVGLDPVLRRELWQTFSRLAAAGATLLISSHVMDEASRCDEVLLMREGGLLAQDEPERLLQLTGTDDLETAFLRLADTA